MRAIPPLVTELAQRCRERGARALLVGGGVRDRLLGADIADWDVEVFGLPEDDLLDLLHQIGRVNAVGRSFGVFKVARRGLEIEVSMPRRDSKVGPGHRGIRVEGDPAMPPVEAARRRDLTINAILEDPLTGEIIDPFGGREDLALGLLRAVDAETFLEDPLRALRAVQFAARLGFGVDPGLIGLCREAALDELPPERIQGEWTKLLLKGRRPSLGLALAREAELLPRVFPEAAAVDHLDVDVALDRLAAGPRDRQEPEGRRLAVMLGAWLHRGTSATVEATLDRLWLHKWKGYPLRERVTQVVRTWSRDPADDVALRRLATETELRATLLVRGAVTGDPGVEPRLARAEALGIAEQPPEPILRGRLLEKSLGVPPGPAMGALLKHVYELQLDGHVTDLDGAREAAAQYWTRART